ncbi:MAG: hypothetical protein IT460_11710 [Planctomycetes bacterium]|nr:hypothetical protein [Planctomycetota bacterium]
MSSKRLASRDVLWIGVISGLCGLLCVAVALGLTKGFDRPSVGIAWRLVAAPGIALGWGGVALVLVAIPYALLTWMRGRAGGKLVSVLGALVFAFGVGGLAGLFTHPAAAGGGRLAGGLATLLRDGVGTGFATALLALIAVPGLLLALAPLVLAGTGAKVASGPAVPVATSARGWYPERRVGDDGEELPVEFRGSADVGPVRYRDAGETPAPAPVAATTSLSPPAATGPAAKKPKTISGVRFADEPTEAPVAAPPPPAEAAEDALPAGVRYAPTSAPAPVPLEALGAPTEPEAPATAPALPEVTAAAAPQSADAPPAPTSPAGTEALAPEVAPPAPAETSAPSGPTDAPAPGSLDERRKRSESYRRKLSATGIVDGPRPDPEEGGARPPPRPKPRPARPRDVADAIRGLFSSLPMEELPPVQPAIDPPEPVRTEEPRVDAPGQTALVFDAPAADAVPARRGSTASDPLFSASVEAALERGAASLVLLKRKLGVGYARAASLMEALVAEGIVGEMSASGSRPTLITATEWARRRAAS